MKVKYIVDMKGRKVPKSKSSYDTRYNNITRIKATDAQ